MRKSVLLAFGALALSSSADAFLSPSVLPLRRSEALSSNVCMAAASAPPAEETKISQAAPESKLPLNKAKEGALKANAEQWGIGAAAAEETKEVKIPEGAPETKLPLNKAKEGALKANEKQWGIGAAKASAETEAPVAKKKKEEPKAEAASAEAPAAEAEAPAEEAEEVEAEPDMSAIYEKEVKAALSKLKGDLQAAEQKSEQTQAEAEATQAALNDIAQSALAKLEAMGKKASDKMGTSAPPPAAATGASASELKKFREDAVKQVKKQFGELF